MKSGHFPNVTDNELVLYALLGDMAAFDALVARFRSAVVLIATREIGRRDLAEEVAQEAFLLAFKALPQLQDPTKFAGWLYAITRHRARRVSLGERHAEPTESTRLDRLILAHTQALTAPPEQRLIRDCERARIATAVAQLPDDIRLALQLRYEHEWPVARIAAFLSLPQTTVKWRLHHGRRLLRRRLHTAEGDKNENG